MMLVAKDAIIIPSEAKRPPTIITGRHPKRFTRMLHRGPASSKLLLASRILNKTKQWTLNMLTLHKNLQDVHAEFETLY